MSYLLDTSVWMWALDSFERLPSEAREILTNGREEIFLSAVTTWELSIKMALGKLKFPAPPARTVPRFIQEQNLKPLTITHRHAAMVYELPLHHRDPFDRLLIAQSIAENLTLLTADREFRMYEVSLLWCG